MAGPARADLQECLPISRFASVQSRLFNDKGSHMPALVIIHGSNRGEYHNLPSKTALVVGRDESLFAQLQGDPGVSRRHLEFIKHDDGKCFAVDLQSRNGIRINGIKVNHSEEVVDGDVIQVGHSLIVFVNKDLDANSPVDTFLKACEKIYQDYLLKMRDYDKRMATLMANASANANDGTLNLGTVVGH